MKSNNVKVKVGLKDVLVVYSGIKEASAFKPGDTPKYNLSCIVRGESLKKLWKAFSAATEGLKSYKKEEFKDEKFKKPSEWAKENLGDSLEEKDQQINLSTKNKPIVHDYKNNIKDPNVFGGDKVNVLVQVIYYPEVKKLGFTLMSVALVEKGDFAKEREFDVSEEDEWLSLNDISSDDVKNLDKKESVESVEKSDSDVESSGLSVEESKDEKSYEELPF